MPLNNRRKIAELASCGLRASPFGCVDVRHASGEASAPGAQKLLRDCEDDLVGQRTSGLLTGAPQGVWKSWRRATVIP